MSSKKLLKTIAQGEGLHTEFKRGLSKLDREIAAFANSKGGSILIGVSDDGKIEGYQNSNRARSEIQSTARNLDPPVHITLHEHPEGVLEIHVPESERKPHRSKEGFFVRHGASTEKLRTDEIRDLIFQFASQGFDSSRCREFSFETDFDFSKYREFCTKASIDFGRDPLEVLENLLLLQTSEGDDSKELFFTNAAALFFAKDPQKFFPEDYVTAAQYNGADRTNVLSRSDIKDGIIQMIDRTAQYLAQFNGPAYIIDSQTRRTEAYPYPPAALREAIVNAIMHRNYFTPHTRTYIHIHPKRIEIENPGGLMQGMDIKDLGKKSIRRNPLIADILFRARYVEAIGSGFSRMRSLLEENQNPNLLVEVDTGFSLTFYARDTERKIQLTQRQSRMLEELSGTALSSSELSDRIGVSKDTIVNEVKTLLELGLVEKVGRGRGTKYLYRS